ncbi:MAG: hypothetical protein V2J07_09450, partial [Anaerolineae bacterium]|nr:hypothetical protein [Anaerolineae bacterium]
MLKMTAFLAFTVLLLMSCTPAAETPATRVPTLVTPSTTAIPPTSTQTSTPLPTETSTPTPLLPSEITPGEPSPTATIEAAFTRPSSYLISPIYGERQAYDLSCESRSAVDWAAYYGLQILEADFQFNLPFSDNPDFGFVGVTTGKWGQVPPYDYGVHAAPVAELLREYGLPAVAEKNMDLDQLKDIIAQNHPVIAWVIGNVVGGVPHTYTDSQGNPVTV